MSPPPLPRSDGLVPVPRRLHCLICHSSFTNHVLFGPSGHLYLRNLLTHYSPQAAHSFTFLYRPFLQLSKWRELMSTVMLCPRGTVNMPSIMAMGSLMGCLPFL
jgi:hypothetical protein